MAVKTKFEPIDPVELGEYNIIRRFMKNALIWPFIKDRIVVEREDEFGDKIKDENKWTVVTNIGRKEFLNIMLDVYEQYCYYREIDCPNVTVKYPFVSGKGSRENLKESRFGIWELQDFLINLSILLIEDEDKEG